MKKGVQRTGLFMLGVLFFISIPEVVYCKPNQIELENPQNVADIHNYSQMQLEGKNVSRDSKKDFESIIKAANLGEPRAQNEAGLMYHFGKGVCLDYKKAKEWYEKAANQGYVSAQNNLGLLYYHGQGVS